MSDDKIAEIMAAKVNKQRAEIERLTSHVALVAERARQLSDERDYAWGEVEKLRAEIERLKRDSDEVRDESKQVQEPVAWRNKKYGYFTVNQIASKHTDWEPLYTAQQPRQLRNALKDKP